MDKDLAAYLERYPAAHTDEAVWGRGLRLRIGTGLADDLPPEHLSSSVRCVVRRGSEVLVIIDGDADNNRNIAPGGRREPGETIEQTVRRELLEETGWSVGELVMIGYIHLHHVSERPRNHPYPYPDVIWPVFTAEADRRFPERRLPDDYVTGSEFMNLDAARAILGPGELLLLNAAFATTVDPAS